MQLKLWDKINHCLLPAKDFFYQLQLDSKQRDLLAAKLQI